MTTLTRPGTPGASLVSLAVAAEEFGISVKTVRRRISDGTVHGYLVGRLIRVDIEELRERMLVEIPTRKRVDR
jgi:DNA-binding Lrp family transcriptional regulator